MAANVQALALVFLEHWNKGDIGGALREFAGAINPTDPSDEVAAALRNAAMKIDCPVAIVKTRGGVVQGAVSNVPGLDVLVLDYDTEGADPADLVSIPEMDDEPDDAHYWWCSPLHDANYANQITSIVDLHDQPNDGGMDASLARIPPYDRNGEQSEAVMLAWFKVMHAHGLAFHPEDDPASVVSGVHGGRVFTDREADELRLILQRMTHAFGSESVCKAALGAILPRATLAE